MPADTDSFMSAPIKLAARISCLRSHLAGTMAPGPSGAGSNDHARGLLVATRAAGTTSNAQRNNLYYSCSSGARCPASRRKPSLATTAPIRARPQAERAIPVHQPAHLGLWLFVATCYISLILPPVSASGHQSVASLSMSDRELQQARHHAHYINIVPSTHFQYNEGRQPNGDAMGAREAPLGDTPAAQAELASELAAPAPVSGRSSRSDTSSFVGSPSHIYKRSSAALMMVAGNAGPAAQADSAQLNGPPAPAPQARHVPLVSSSRDSGPMIGGPANPLSRRMMSSASGEALFELQQPDWQASPGARARSSGGRAKGAEAGSVGGQEGGHHQHAMLATSGHDYDSELLRQKQHIQYHDQWPVAASSGSEARCHKRTLNFCASVLPFNTTTFPNIIGDTNRFEVKRSLPFFGFLAKSSCNRRLDELLCLLLEPPCQVPSGRAIPPCKKFCRLALEGCNEYIPATLALSSVFDCRQYPDSNDPNVCINLAQGSKCSADEFKCPDKTCIPRNWLCDGVRDCIFAADEANCTAPAQASVCSTEEFKCDGKCVPKAWKCDGERDCLDGTDEESCDSRPRCGQDRFKCADGNGCIPKRWVCDGKAECRDGSDEMNCEQRDCSENDFKCGNGICIPKLWRCDRQFDCKDGSDEHYCVYPTPSTTTTTTTTTSTTKSPVTTALPSDGEPATDVNRLIPTTTTTALSSELSVASSVVNSSYEIHDNQQVSDNSGRNGQPGSGAEPQAVGGQQQQQQQQQLETSLNNDVSRIIQLESSGKHEESPAGSSAASGSTLTPMTTFAIATTTVSAGQTSKQAEPRPDYELIQSMNQNELAGAVNSSSNQSLPADNQTQAVTNEFAAKGPLKQQQQQTQIEFATLGQQPSAATLGHPLGAHQSLQQQPHPSAGQPGDLPSLPARLPIYRSLFKSFNKGHHQHHPSRSLMAGAGVSGPFGGQRGNVVAIARRRRDRQQNQLHPAAPMNQMHQFHEQPVASYPEQQQQAMDQQHHQAWLARQQHQHQQHQQHAARNHTRPLVYQQQVGGGMSSYFQLLNNKYNLRNLASRSGPPVPQAAGMV